MYMTNKREYDRLAVAMEVTHDKDGVVTRSRATNLSYGGMQVKLAHGGLARGDRLQLEFRLPAASTRVLATAEVVYSDRGFAGLRFTHLPHVMRRDLDDYVSSRLAGIWFKLDEKRETERVPVALEVTLDHEGQRTPARAMNLCFDGMQVRVQGGAIHHSDRIEAEFELPLVPQPVRCDAEVVYMRGKLAGLHFLYVPSEMQRRLDDFVSTCLSSHRSP